MACTKQIYVDGKYSVEIDTEKGLFYAKKNGIIFYKSNVQAQAYKTIEDAKNEELGITIKTEFTDYDTQTQDLKKNEDDYYSTWHPHLKCYTSFKEKKETYNSIVFIESYSQLIKLVDALSGNPQLVYRGINNSAYKSYSSSQRRYLVGEDKNLQKYGMKSGTIKLQYHSFIENILSEAHSNKSFKSWLKEHDINDDNDFYILSSLQHYVTCAPLLDFSTNIYSSLFFCIDRAEKCKKICRNTHKKHPTHRKNKEKQISDFVSLYVINGAVDWIEYDLQEVVTEWKLKSDKLKSDPNNHGVDFRDDDNKRRRLPYESFSDIDFVTVKPSDGPDTFVNNEDIRKIFLWNERVEAQSGFFILNNTQSVPLFELLKALGTEISVTSYEIHKKLIPAIKRICRKNGITKNTIYPVSVDSLRLLKSLQEIIV